jgi:steroid delta-isomerase-like uncharacterized protein
MSTEANKAAYRRLIEEVFNRGNLAVVDELVAADAVDHSGMPGRPEGAEGVKWAARMFRTAFPDLHFTVEDQVAEDDRLVNRFTVRGTHRGEFMGIPPTGRQVTVGGIDLIRVRDGRAVEHWVHMDMLGLMQQLGVIPAPGAAG